MFSDQQKKISMALFEETKTLDEIKKFIQESSKPIDEEIEKMIKLGVVEKLENGKFKLSEKVSEPLKKRKEQSEADDFKVRLTAIIELQAVEKTLLKKQLDKIKQAINEDNDFHLYDIFEAEIKQQENEYFSSFLELNFSVKNFQAIIKFLFFYGPSSIEVIKPQKIEIDAHDFQEGLVELSDMIHKYADYITKLMNRKELEDFNKKLFE